MPGKELRPSKAIADVRANFRRRDKVIETGFESSVEAAKNRLFRKAGYLGCTRKPPRAGQ
jgi:hypothetical protein